MREGLNTMLDKSDNWLDLNGEDVMFIFINY